MCYLIMAMSLQLFDFSEKRFAWLSIDFPFGWGSWFVSNSLIGDGD